MITEQLGDILDIRSLSAPCACAGEFKQRLCELGVLHVGLRIERSLVSNLGVEVVEIILLGDIVKIRLHRKSLVFGEADIHTVAASRTVGYGH